MFTVGSFSTYIIVLVSNALKHGIEACRKRPSMSQLPVPFTYGLISIEYHFPGDVSNDHQSKKRHRLK
jgi:hypothetical protein